MKKLLTIIVTLCIFFIGFNKAFAVNSNVIIANTLRVGYTTQQGTSTMTQVSFNGYRTTVSLNDYSNLDSIEIFFSGQNAPFTEHLVFSGYLDFSQDADVSQGSSNYLPDNMSIIGLSDSNDHRIGACTLNNLSVTRFTSNLDSSSSGILWVRNGVTLAFTADCRIDQALANGANMNRLQFYIPTPLNGNEIHTTNITMQINPGVIGYDGEYTEDIQAVVDAINNITINGATVNVDQSPVTGAISNQTQDIINNQNNNTQQIVDQLTSESCSTCDNIMNVPNQSSSFNNIIKSCSDQICSYSGTFNGSGYFPLVDSVNIPSGTYIFKLSQSVNHDIRPMFNQDNCVITAGSTSVTCTISQSRNVGFRYNFSNGEIVNYTNLSFYVGSSGDFCVYGSEVCTGSNKLDNINDTLQQTQDYLTESPEQGISNAVSNIQRTLQDIEEEDSNYYLLDFVRLPLILLRNLNNGGMCQPIVLHLPYLYNKDLTIPCMRPIIEQYFGSLLTFYQGCITVFMSYWIFSKVYKLLKGFSDLNSNEAEKAI